jgi:hypothetical protein
MTCRLLIAVLFLKDYDKGMDKKQRRDRIEGEADAYGRFFCMFVGTHYFIDIILW